MPTKWMRWILANMETYSQPYTYAGNADHKTIEAGVACGSAIPEKQPSMLIRDEASTRTHEWTT